MPGHGPTKTFVAILATITCLLPLHNFDSLLELFHVNSQSYYPPNPEPYQDSWTSTEGLIFVDAHAFSAKAS